MPSVTPMMRQYLEIKERHEDSVLFFRLGDFYEMFGDDARTASRELELTLTTRDRSTDNPDDRIPMCGVPYHSSETYIARLIAKGYKVAICEQVEDPATAQGLVDRDIVRVVTPGTLIESSMLDEGKPNYLCAAFAGETSAVCFADLSTGEISVTAFPSNDVRRIENELCSFAPSEAILGGDADICSRLREYLTVRPGCLVQFCDERFGDGGVDGLGDEGGSVAGTAVESDRSLSEAAS
jgi:DNA mismatch repair protein MutS